MSDPTKCRSCGAAIRFVPTASGRTMPIDIEPSPDGNVAVRKDGLACVVHGETRDNLYDAGEPLYLSHFATCPAAAKHRKRRA